MIYAGRVARRTPNDLVRGAVFKENSVEPLKPSGKLRRGRPRQQWGPMVMANCLKLAGSQAVLADYFRPERGAAKAWERVVRAWRT